MCMTDQRNNSITFTLFRAMALVFAVIASILIFCVPHFKVDKGNYQQAFFHSYIVGVWERTDLYADVFKVLHTSHEIYFFIVRYNIRWPA